MSTDPLTWRRSAALLALGSLCYAAFTFVWFTFAAFLPPIVAELGLSNTMAGFVNGAIPLTYIPVALASGLLVDRIGPGRAIGIGLALLGAAQALRSTADGFVALVTFTVLIGVGGTGVTFGLPKLVAEAVPPERTGTGTSIYIVGASAGTAAAFSLGRPVLGPFLGGWRPVFLWSGLVVVGFAVVWLVVARRTLDRPDADRPDADRPARSVRADVRTVVTNRSMRLLVVIGTMYLLLTHGTQAWVQTIFEVRGLTTGVAAGLTTLLVVGRTIGVLAIPPLSDLVGLRRPVLVACGVLSAVGVGGLVVSGADPWFSAAVVLVAGVGVGGLSPLVRTLPIELPGIGPRLTATATGLVFAVGEAGGFLGPVLVGTLYDLTGTYAAGLVVLSLAGVAVILAGSQLPETGDTAGRSAPE